MGKKKQPRPAPEQGPKGWRPTQAVADPVVNRPYEEPSRRWVYRDTGEPYLTDGRRPASYFYRTRKTGTTQETFFGDEQSDELPLVNRLRNDVKRWRESGYRGASAATRDLLAHWSRPDRARRLFFCQLEATETIIYLLEIAIPGRLASTGFKNFDEGVSAENLSLMLRGERPRFPLPSDEYYPRLVDPPFDSELLTLRRLGCKMATGSGKTIVMAMLIAWAFVNRGRNPATTTFPSAILVCAPNLTVRRRLEVLKPGEPGNYYDAFDLVPTKYRDLLGVGRILITNWHALALKNEHSEGGMSYRVVDKGVETPEAFAKDRLGELAERLPLLVLNDEGHHCWRPKGVKGDEGPLTSVQKKELERELDEARVWLGGLDRINNAGLLGLEKPCVLACVDLSATPFYIGGSGYDVGSPFPWLVSDFGLVDAIESGIVKIPRLPVSDDTNAKDDVGRPDPKFFRLWRRIDDELKPHERVAGRRPKPEAIYEHAESALATLAAQWKARFDAIQEGSPGDRPIPPVMIVVCDNTDIADVFYRKLSGERVVEVKDEDGEVIEKTVYDGSAILTEFGNTETHRHTIRIDSKLLAKIETEDGETRDEAAEALRRVINSVGKRGEPGEQIRCVVSVSMLTEGWDATNVTHILGVRAFDSQLLCEQVVGRGLRRMSYTPDPTTGMLAAEYVDVYGIPFSLIPFKGKPTEASTADPVTHHVYALDERKKLEVRMPVVESYTYEVTGAGIRCDVAKLAPLAVKGEPNAVFVAPTRGYRDKPASGGAGDEVEHTREEFYAQVRVQQVLFKLAQEIVDDLVGGFAKHENKAIEKALLARHLVFPDVLKIVEDYVATRVTYAQGVDARELALEIYKKKLRERLRSAIVPAAGKASLRPVINSYHPVATTAKVNYATTRPVMSLTKSHLNCAVLRSSLEREAIEALEVLDVVEAFAPNDRQVGFHIVYEYGGGPHLYEPDFLVRVRGGAIVLLEIKGVGGLVHEEDIVNAKNDGTRKWVEAVNNTKVHGTWAFEFCDDLNNLAAQLERHAMPLAQAARPFRFVEPKPGDRFKTCVPLTTLRVAAGRFSDEQSNIDTNGEWASDWVTFDTKTPFEPGMFVARIQGDSMSPQVPDGSYCLFSSPRSGSRQGRKLLVWHAGVSDRHTGGTYSLKIYSSEKVQTGEGERHSRITLSPINKVHEPIVLTPEHEGDVGVIAELVEVLAQPLPSRVPV